MPLHIVILAAGQGTRMHSALPKVLHQLAGKPLLQWVLETASALHPDKIHVIVGHQKERIQTDIEHPMVNWVEQKEQLGTGHAVLQTLPHIPKDAEVLLLSADVPLIAMDTLQDLQNLVRTDDEYDFLHLLTARLDNPFGLGRILRDESGHIQAIVEEKDANAAQKTIQEIYSGISILSGKALHRWLPKLDANNAQKEFYLTDIIAMAVAEEVPVSALCIDDQYQVAGVNTRAQLQQLERHWQRQQAERLMSEGVTIADGNRLDIRGDLDCASDVFIDINVLIEGKVSIASGARIGANVVLKNCHIAAGVTIHPFCHIEGADIGERSCIGPYARLREGSVLAEDCKIGNFVETKKISMGKESKASHLSYLGDACIGSKVNIGAGTITCNYDGVNKHTTVIEDGAFIGSDTQLVAPVRVGKEATIGAGSCVRKDAPAGQLTLTHSAQKTISQWQRPRKRSS